MTEILSLILLVIAVFAALTLAIRWTHYLADWFWLLPHAPKLTGTVTIFTVFLIAVGLRLVSQIALVGPLTLAIELLFMPIIAVQAVNCAAFCFHWHQVGVKPAGPWRDFIFDSCRRAQRDKYEAPPVEPF